MPPYHNECKAHLFVHRHPPPPMNESLKRLYLFSQDSMKQGTVAEHTHPLCHTAAAQGGRKSRVVGGNVVSVYIAGIQPRVTLYFMCTHTHTHTHTHTQRKPIGPLSLTYTLMVLAACSSLLSSGSSTLCVLCLGPLLLHCDMCKAFIQCV